MLTRVDERLGKILVDMRELYQALRINAQYDLWAASMLDNKDKNTDFWQNDGKYEITIDLAESICKLQPNKIGEQIYKSLERINNSKTGLRLRLQAANEEISRLKAKISKDKPKVRFANALGISGGCISVGELASILTQNGFPIGCNRLFEKLREDGYLLSKTSRNLPSQKALDLNLFEVERSLCFVPKCGMMDTQRPVVTPKGQMYLLNKYLAYVSEDKNVPKIIHLKER